MNTSCRYYSTSNSDSYSSNLPPVPILTFNNLNNEDCIKSYIRLLKGKGGKTDYGYKLRHYSTSNKLRNTPLDNENKSNLIILKPNYITGFCDAESTFGISVVKSKTHKIG